MGEFVSLVQVPSHSNVGHYTFIRIKRHRDKTLAHSTYLKSSSIRGAGVKRSKKARSQNRCASAAGHSTYLKSSLITGGSSDRFRMGELFIPVESTVMMLFGGEPHGDLSAQRCAPFQSLHMGAVDIDNTRPCDNFLFKQQQHAVTLSKI